MMLGTYSKGVAVSQLGIVKYIPESLLYHNLNHLSMFKLPSLSEVISLHKLKMKWAANTQQYWKYAQIFRCLNTG